MKKAFIFALMLIITLSCFSVGAFGNASFKDLASSHWAYSEIIDLADRGVISGFPDGTYRPEESVTREQFISIIVSVFEIATETEAIFADVPTSRWSNADVAAAVKRNIIIPAEYGNLLGAEAVISREEAAILIVRALDIGGVASEMTPVDNESIKRARIAAIGTANAIGLLVGMADDIQAPTTRAHAAVLLMRMLELFVHTITITGDGIATQTLNATNGHRIYDYIPSAPEREGYRFLGWYLSDETKIDQSTLIEQDVTLTARWYKLESAITITGEGVARQTFNAPNGESFSDHMPPQVRRGYTFTGWYINGTTELDLHTLIEQDITLTANWEKIEYDLTPSLLLFALSVMIFVVGMILGKWLFKDSQRKSEVLCTIFSVLFTIAFTFACWFFLTAYTIPIDILPAKHTEKSIIPFTFADSIDTFALFGGLIAPLIGNVLLSGILPLRLVSPADIFPKERQYLIHLLITPLGLIWPIALWLLYGVGISMFWLLGYALVAYTISFVLSALLFRQGNSQRCSRFFFDL